MEAHIRGHTGEKPFPCPFEGCTYRATLVGNLSNHQLICKYRTTEKSARYKCSREGCNYMTNYTDQFDAHQRFVCFVLKFMRIIVNCMYVCMYVCMYACPRAQET